MVGILTYLMRLGLTTSGLCRRTARKPASTVSVCSREATPRTCRRQSSESPVTVSATELRHGFASWFDLPCQVCELAGVLGQVKTHLGTRGGGVADNIALEWLLKRLPGKVSHMTALSRSLKVERCRARGAGNGLDLQCAGNVAKSWLTRGPLALQKSMWHLFLLGRSDPFQAPTLHCAVCVGQLGDAATSGHRKTCDACRRAHRQSWDRQRQQLNRK